MASGLIGKYSSKLKVITLENESCSSSCNLTNSLYKAIGDAPVANPNTVGMFFYAFSNIKDLISEATNLAPSLAVTNTLF